MAADNASARPALGFLTVLDHPEHGLFGGYLLLSLTGRPLEFHCTAPVKPNRAQQILYGPTLESFLYGEQIGFTLLEQAKIAPLVVCTDREPVLSVRDLVATPVVLVVSGENPGDGVAEALPSSSNRLVTFDLGRNRLAVHERTEGDRPLIFQRLAEVAQSLDLAEPFGRIREAIEEAQQAAR